MAEKRVSMRDIAKECGVSVATVSHALNHATRENVSEALRLKIIQTATKMHYNPAALRDRGAVQTAGIIVQAKVGDRPAKTLQYYDVAFELSRALAGAGFCPVMLTVNDAKAAYANEALRRLDAWLLVDVDEAAFGSKPEGYYGAVLLVDGEVAGCDHCKVQTDWTSVYEQANALLSAQASFLVMEDVCSRALVEKMVAPFAASSVYIDRPQANLAAFLQNQRGRKGIVLGDILGAQVQSAFEPNDVVVVSRLESDGLLLPGTPRLKTPNREKAAVAVQAMQAMQNYEYEPTGTNHILVGCTE